MNQKKEIKRLNRFHNREQKILFSVVYANVGKAEKINLLHKNNKIDILY